MIMLKCTCVKRKQSRHAKLQLKGPRESIIKIIKLIPILVVFGDRFLAVDSLGRIHKQSFARESVNRSSLSHQCHKNVSLFFQRQS